VTKQHVEMFESPIEVKSTVVFIGDWMTDFDIGKKVGG